MDTLTHALVGAVVSDCWFRKRLGPFATPFALAASSLPDIDIAAYLVAPEYAWANHRGYTHSFFIFLFAAPLLGIAASRISAGAGGIRQWMLLAFLCLAVHTLGDLITGWGTMPLLPFSNIRASWDILPIIDVFVTSTAAASFLLNRALRREKVETFLNPVAFPRVSRHPRRVKAAGVATIICVCLLAAYVALGWLQNRQAVGLARRELSAAGVEAVEVRALPCMFTYIAYGIAARDADGTVYNTMYSSMAPKPMLFERCPAGAGAAVEAAKNTPEGKMFIWYSQGMYAADTEMDGGGVTVRFRDRRFFSLAQPYASRYVMEFSGGEDGRITGVRSVQAGPGEMDPGRELRALWNLTVHGETNPVNPDIDNLP